MSLYIEIALGVVIGWLLLTQASMLRGLIERIISAVLQLIRDILGTLERILTAPFRAFSR